MRIGQLARSIGVNVETIRYYQRIGLSDLPAKPYGGCRSYNDQDLRRLRRFHVRSLPDRCALARTLDPFAMKSRALEICVIC
jgi:hypothetical protein